MSHIKFSQVRTAGLLLMALAASGATAVAESKSPAPITPRIEIFAGYSYLYPNAVASGYLPNGIVPVSSCLCAIPDGGGLSVNLPLNPWLGVTVAGSAHVGGSGTTNATRIGNADDYNLVIGPQFKLRHKHFEPFAEVLVGGDRLSPSPFHQDTGFGLLAGGGLDMPLGQHIAVRVFQADVDIANHTFGASPAVPTHMRGVQLQSGVVFRFGGKAIVPAPVPVPPAPVVIAPVPVPVPAPVDVVTLTAQAQPAQVIAGESSTIVAQGNSSLGRPLTYSFSSSAGVIAGNGATAILTTAGLADGTAIVTANVVDDMGMMATATVPVVMTMSAAVMPAATSALCSMSFARDQRRPARVNNEAKACLDEIALNLQRNSDERLALVGSAGVHEHDKNKLAAERAEHTREYLVQEKGIDASRIDIYTSGTDAKEVNSVVIPAGAMLDTTGTTKVVAH
jgi:outer membrane protein OmpA-like peptidoglycan-associated protein